MKIEKNVPIPSKDERRGQWTAIAKKWQVGDSVSVKTLYDANCLRLAAKNLSQKVVQHKEENGNTRLWRIK